MPMKQTSNRRGSRLGGEERRYRKSGRNQNRGTGHQRNSGDKNRPDGMRPDWVSDAGRALIAFVVAAIFILPLSSDTIPVSVSANPTSGTHPTALPTATPLPTAIPEPDATSVPWAHNLMPPVENKIYMTWDYRPNTLDKVPPGVNVLAPTWFYVEEDDEGNPEVHGLNELNGGGRSGWDPEQYVTTAHEGGAQVWAVAVLLNNAELVTKLVRSDEYMEAFIDRCNLWIDEYELDGISFDFEYMDSADIDAFTAFVGKCKQGFREGTVVSAAVNYKLAGDQSKNWWQSYDPGGLAQVCDYVAVMTYSGYVGKMSPVSGIGWLQAEIEEMLLEVPSNQLLMGVPFYGAEYQSEVVGGDVFKVDPLWSESREYRHDIVPATVERALTIGEFTISGTTYTVDYWINRGEWNPQVGITTWSFVDTEGMMHTLWCEDENSLYQKGILASDYHLGGVAVWRMSQGRDAMWEALGRGLQEQ